MLLSTAPDYNGVEIMYDEIGNPLNDGTWTYTWGAGRQLRQMSKPGMAVHPQYDHNGLRTQNAVTENGVTMVSEYTLHGKLITHMTKRTVDESDNETTQELHFFYDAQSRPAFVEYNGTMYRYVHNLQGDIVGLLDNNGALVVEYKYDAWGKPISMTGLMASTLGKQNPFRYRRYVWDMDTNMYYLRSRFYAPSINRLINSDGLIDSRKSFCHSNLFAYGRSNPLTYDDPSGHSPKDTLSAIIAAIENGLLSIKNILIVGRDLYTGKGKKYPLYQPPMKPGTYLSAKYDKIASGKSSLQLTFPELALSYPIELDEHNQIISILNMLSIAKNAIVWVDMNVTIESNAGITTRARVTVQFHANTTVDHFGTGIKENKVVDSRVLTLLEVTDADGLFWDGERCFTISNDKEWLTSLIAGIELSEV